MNQRQAPRHPQTAPRFTEKQGQYLAFIHAYTVINQRPPAQADMQRHFHVTPPTVHQMVLKLEQQGLIERKTGQPRSIKIIIDTETLPVITSVQSY